MTVFHWVRHGPTHQKTFVGWRDVPADLSDQACLDRLSAYLPTEALVVSSDLRRSADTATAICGGRTRLPSMPGLREFHFGTWEARHFSDITERHGDLSRAYWDHPGDVAPPGGESWNAARHRIDHAVNHLLRHHAGQTLIVVAHIGVILTQVQRARDCTPQDVISQKIDNLSVTTIDLSGTRPNVREVNHAP